ncbi:MAG: hypothetical protein H0W83_07830 [Planctomycetes bacterium]|nr:hypothetical protein [Planctomycetota bacterium]
MGWLHWVVLIGVVLLAGLMAGALFMRDLGFRRYSAVVAEQRSRGVPTSIEELIGLAPPVDRSVQARWRALTDRLLAADINDVAVNDLAFAQLVAVDVAAASPADDRYQRLAHVMAEVRQELARGPVGSGFGWLAEHFSTGRRDLAYTVAMPVANLLANRLMAEWFACDALAHPDPEEALADLDRLKRTLGQPATLIDACILLAVQDIRDVAHLRLDVLGRLSPGRRMAWRTESAHQLDAMADGLRGERILSFAAIIESDRTETYALRDVSGVLSNRVSLARRLNWYLFSGDDGAVGSNSLLRCEERLRQRCPDFSRSDLKAELRGIGMISYPNVSECSITAWDHEARGRMLRLADAISERGSPLPADGAEVERQPADLTLLRPGGDSAALLYERLSDDRFRITIDPATPVPDFADAGHIASQSMAGKPPTLVGMPARLLPLVISRHAVEVMVPAR